MATRYVALFGDPVEGDPGADAERGLPSTSASTGATSTSSPGFEAWTGELAPLTVTIAALKG